MTTEKIYVHLIDGTDVWVPVEAKQVESGQFIILENNEYTDYVDSNYLFEFYPGDTVELGASSFIDSKKVQVAKRLIKKGQWQDRNLNEFKYKAAQGQLSIDQATADKYRDEIELIKKEHLAGQFFYPAIIETMNKLESLTNDKEV